MSKLYVSVLIAWLFTPVALFSMGAGACPQYLCDENNNFVYVEDCGHDTNMHGIEVKIYFLHCNQKKAGVLTQNWNKGTERFFFPNDPDGFYPFYFIKKKKQWYKNPSFFLNK